MAPMPELPIGERLSSREIFTGRVFALSSEQVRFPNGHLGEVDLIRHPGATCIVPLAENGDVLLIRQYRHATGGWLLEVPAGTLKPGEPLEECAHRELEEESGYRAARLEPLGFIWTTPGFTNERIWLYLATGLARSEQNLDADESLTVERCPLSEAIRMVRTGEISDAKSMCALFRAEMHLKTSDEMIR
ncbi:MAG: NUDIX hydrolase [Acidobacteriota bacterium]